MENKNFNWRPMSEYTGGRVLATNGLDVLIGEINSEGDCESEEDSGTILCGITGFIKIEEMLPELKESEDERMLREIKRYIKEQGDKPTGLPNGTAAVADMIAWLEKQGEQEEPQVYETENGEVITYSESEGYKVVKPKFKVGDWVVTSYGKVNQVVSVDKDGDGYTLDDGMYFSGSWCDMYHLWSIEDAKDGDVLSWDDSKCIALFKNIYDEDSFNSHGLVGHCTGTFEPRQAYHDIEGAHPATKEQRDLLFQKMKEAGYEWDAEKKELKKIEQKPAWDEEDENKLSKL